VDLGVSWGSSPLATELDENNTLDERRDVLKVGDCHCIKIALFNTRVKNDCLTCYVVYSRMLCLCVLELWSAS